jgi:GTPase SAR1 family protein
VVVNVDTPDVKTQKEHHKVILLGAGNSGKTTISKQIQQLYNSTFDEQAMRNRYIPIIHSNVLRGLLKLAEVVKLPVEVAVGFKKLLNELHMAPYSNEMLEEYHTELISHLWVELRAVFIEQQTSLNVLENLQYFCDNGNITRLLAKGYLPDVDDVMRCWSRTTGIVEFSAPLEGDEDVVVDMVDVGGQRAERNKWAICGKPATALIFVVGLGSFDEALYEDPRVLKIHEDLQLWETVSSQDPKNPFRSIPKFLIFNKIYAFNRKTRKMGSDAGGNAVALATNAAESKQHSGNAFNAAFPGYQDSEYGEPLAYVKHVFRSKVQELADGGFPAVPIYTVEAVNIECVKTVIADVFTKIKELKRDEREAKNEPNVIKSGHGKGEGRPNHKR